MPNKLTINLNDLLHQRTVESARIEYKAGWNPDAILRTLCAFANDFENLGGGYLVIGQACDDNGQPEFPPLGIADDLIDKIQQELLAACQLIQPPYFPMLSVEAVEGRKLIVLRAPGMNVIEGPSESPWPKNVGLLFFNEAPDKLFPYTEIDVVWFPEGAGGDRFDEKIFKGPLARMTREALGYIQRNYLYETVLKHPDKAQATRVWNFPYTAVEEALVNAVYHRSYEEREPIEVRISRDELVILSFPGPDRSIRLTDFEAGRAVSRRYRNRRIGELLKELELTEGRSTGVPKILKAMAANGSPAPLFETDDERIAYVIRLPVHPLAKIPEVTVSPALAKNTDQVTDQVSLEVARVLAVAGLGEQPRSALQTVLGLKHTPHFRREYLLPALASGLLEMTRPDVPNSRLQRYRLTEKGKQWLRQHPTEGNA